MNAKLARQVEEMKKQTIGVECYSLVYLNQNPQFFFK